MVACSFSGGPDSTALLALAVHHGLVVTAHHVDHGLRIESSAEADQAVGIARRLGAEIIVHRVDVAPGANVEARARDARLDTVPTDAMTGHTADDQAETVLLRLLRGSGGDGLAAMTPGHVHPILGLRRHETEAICTELDVAAVRDASNDRPDVWRNRVRMELLPLAQSIADRDLVPIFTRTADVLRAENEYLDEMAASIDPTDAKALVTADSVLARRAIRRWLSDSQYPPDAAAVERVLAVARGDAIACELPGGRRIERSEQRFRIVPPGG